MVKGPILNKIGSVNWIYFVLSCSDRLDGWRIKGRLNRNIQIETNSPDTGTDIDCQVFNISVLQSTFQFTFGVWKLTVFYLRPSENTLSRLSFTDLSLIMSELFFIRLWEGTNRESYVCAHTKLEDIIYVSIPFIAHSWARMSSSNKRDLTIIHQVWTCRLHTLFRTLR